MNKPKKYNAIVIDPDTQARMRLKTATASVPFFGEVRLQSSLDETLRMLNSAAHQDVVFIANRFEQKDITRFVKGGKETQGGQDSAYVIVLSTKDQESTAVASNVLGGADGLLFEPYSVDQLVEITELAARIKAERSQEREAAALKFLMQDIVKQIDRVAYIKSCGFDVGRNLKLLKDMCGVFETLDEATMALYYEIAAIAFESAPVPNYPKKNYKGVSERVRKKMEQKIVAELEAEAQADEMRRTMK